MSTERALLLQAAKAAKIEHPKGEHHINGTALWDCKALRWWNPLVNDGDALRLAVKLEVDIGFSEVMQQTQALAINYAGVGEVIDRYERWGNDKLAATRRAIVRVAAAIGSDA